MPEGSRKEKSQGKNEREDNKNESYIDRDRVAGAAVWNELWKICGAVLQYGRKKKMKRLSIAEEQIMSIIWNEAEAPDLKTVTTEANLKFGHDWKPQTVSTFLHRLAEKGFITTYRKGRQHYHQPVKDREAYKAAVKAEYEDMFGELNF